MNTEQLRTFFQNLNGKIFSVTFTKKDGTIREMTARLGVKKHLKGGELGFCPVEKGLLPVFDMQKQAYRMINLKTISQIKADGVIYKLGE